MVPIEWSAEGRQLANGAQTGQGLLNNNYPVMFMEVSHLKRESFACVD